MRIHSYIGIVLFIVVVFGLVSCGYTSSSDDSGDLTGQAIKTKVVKKTSSRTSFATNMTNTTNTTSSTNTTSTTNSSTNTTNTTSSTNTTSTTNSSTNSTNSTG